MKKTFILSTLFTISSFLLNAQISNAVTATIVSNATNQVTIYAKSNVNITDKHVDNVVVSVSILDPGMGLRPAVSIITNHLPDVTWSIPTNAPSPYLEGGRYHYDFIANNSINTPGMSTNTWLANSSTPLLTLGFSNSNGFSSTQLDHWDAPIHGSTGFSQFYFQIQQGGNGDITAQNNLFYGSTGVMNDPGGWNSGTSFVPLQPLTVLPVQFSKFVTNCNSNGTSIEWATTQEINASKYEVEKSLDGNNWKSIATVQAAGNSSTEKTYQQLDLNSGKALYRIKQIDADGKFTYTGIETTNCTPKNVDVVIYPVPAKDKLNVAISSNKNINTNFAIYDATGRVVKQFNQKITIGNNAIQIDVNNLPSGQYIIKSTDEYTNINKKFTIFK